MWHRYYFHQSYSCFLLWPQFCFYSDLAKLRLLSDLLKRQAKLIDFLFHGLDEIPSEPKPYSCIWKCSSTAESHPQMRETVIVPRVEMFLALNYSSRQSCHNCFLSLVEPSLHQSAWVFRWCLSSTLVQACRNCFEIVKCQSACTFSSIALCALRVRVFLSIILARVMLLCANWIS